jgi:HEPN domain-containing protein
MKESVEKWIQKAEEDFNTVKILLSNKEYAPSIVCFHCQQTAEKYLKAFLLNSGIDFPKTHDLLELLDNFILPVNSVFEELREEAIILTDYAVGSRYPDFLFNPTKEIAKEAYEAAIKVRKMILSVLG